MGDLYSPTKIHIVAARGNGKSSITMKLCEAVVRADVYQRYDFWTGTVYFYSNNQSAPLTDEEKTLIRNLIVSRIPTLKVVFEDGKYALDISPIEEDLPDWPKENPHIHKSEDLVDEEGNSI